MKTDVIRQNLIDSTIHVVATDGLEKASTKLISKNISTNEVYIYRCFADKEDMLLQAFSSLDEELFAVTMKHVKIMNMAQMSFEERSRLYFFLVWEFLLGNKDKCLTFVQYFYSPSFAKNAAADHELRYKPLVEKFKVAFKEDAEVWMILNHILNVMLDFAVKVHNGFMPNDDIYVEHVFRVVYLSVLQYLKNAKEGVSWL